LRVRQGASLEWRILTGAALGLAPTLLTNIGQGWKGLTGSNTQTYCAHLQIADVKSFITLGPGHRARQGVVQGVVEVHHRGPAEVGLDEEEQARQGQKSGPPQNAGPGFNCIKFCFSDTDCYPSFT
jgi:hypothetical protein